MSTHIAFLRAVNVGGRIVKMDELKRIFTAMGLADVETFIASGNVIFSSPKTAAILERAIEKHLLASLGYAVETFLRSPQELAEILERRPFDEVPGVDATMYVGFLAARPGPENVQKVRALSNAAHDLRIHGRELHWLRRFRSDELEIPLAKLEKALGGRVTVRNVTTVQKLAIKYAASKFAEGAPKKDPAKKKAATSSARRRT